MFFVLTKGMTLIGPRPERPAFCAEFEKRIHGWHYRTMVTPGLSGLARVTGGYDLLPKEKVVLDLWDARRVNKRARLLRQAGFPEPEANVADVRYDPDRKLDKVRIAELSNCEWIRNHRNVLLTGASGAGKSWIASALGVAACNAFFSVRCVRLPEMLDGLTVEKDEEWFKTKKRYLKCDLLILDDWLLEKVSGKGARELLEIVEGRLRTGSLLICSQSRGARSTASRGRCRRRATPRTTAPARASSGA